VDSSDTSIATGVGLYRERIIPHLKVIYERIQVFQFERTSAVESVNGNLPEVRVLSQRIVRDTEILRSRAYREQPLGRYGLNLESHESSTACFEYLNLFAKMLLDSFLVDREGPIG
jgi:hypothetical protein